MVDKLVENMSMDELAEYIFSMTKGSRFRISKLVLEVKDKLEVK